MGYEQRHEERYNVRLAADLRGEEGSASPIRINNLSSWGCRLTLGRKAKLGDLITIAVARVGQLDGQVKWQDGRTIGVRFDGQIPQAYLDHIRLFLSDPPGLVAERGPVAA